MADSASIKEIVNQVAVQAATVVMMAVRDTETVPLPATTSNQLETQRQRHGGPLLERPKFNWGMQDRYLKP